MRLGSRRQQRSDQLVVRDLSRGRSRDLSREGRRHHHVSPLSPALRRSLGAKLSGTRGDPTDVDTEAAEGSRGPGEGRVIKIVSDHDQSVQSRILLNLRTTQRFEDVLLDLGRSIKVKDASKMCTTWGQQVRSFSQLRNDCSETDTFYLSGDGSRLPSAASKTAEGAFSVIENRNPDTATQYRLRASGPSGRGRQRRWTAESRLSDVSPAGRAARARSQRGRQEGATVSVRLLGKPVLFFPPTKKPRADPKPPDRRLKLDWVHGYRGIDSRHNLWVLPSGELLYYVGAIAVLLNPRAGTQRHYTEHTEDIQCMDLHRTGRVAASGQGCGRASPFGCVRLWSTDELQTLQMFGGGELRLGVSAVRFSAPSQGELLLAVDRSAEHLLSVWNWHDQTLVGRTAVQRGEVYGALFHPTDPTSLLTLGRRHFTFWKGRRDGIFDAAPFFAKEARRTVLSVTFESGGDLVAGDADGRITTWALGDDGRYGNKVEFQAHEGPVSALLLISEVVILSGGEEDGLVCAWDPADNYNKRAESKLPETAGGVRTLCLQRPGATDGVVFVGTTNNLILEGSVSRRFNPVVFGHSGPLTGLTVCNEEEGFITAGSDGLVCKWTGQRKLVWKATTGGPAVSCCCHPQDTVVAVGGQKGHLYIHRISDGTHVSGYRVCGQPLNCLSYNPGGDVLAVGADTGNIYLFRVCRDGLVHVKSSPLQGSQPLWHLDWSQDGEFIQSVTSDHQLIFWNKNQLKKEREPQTLRDKHWRSQTCTVGCSVLGAWPDLHYVPSLGGWSDSYADEQHATALTAAHRSPDHELLAVGDSEGGLQLYRYPCPLSVTDTAQSHSYSPHSAPLAAVGFLPGGRTLVTVGGTDASLLLWRVV